MPPAVSVGPGDDAACFLLDGSAVISTDMYVEGVHFRTEWSDAGDIGRKVVAAAVADIEAMGAVPITLLVALGMPRDTSESWYEAFIDGVRHECVRANVALVGGDLSMAPQIVVTVTVVGQTGSVAPVTRDGAQPGQLVAMTGRLGWAAAGLAALGRGFRSPKAVVDAHRFPLVPYGAGREAALAGATAMIDVSDGLLADLGHIADDSGVVIDIATSKLAIGEPVAAVAQALGVDPLDYVLGGGEDHALVATFALGDVPVGWSVIGQVFEPSRGLEAGVLVDGHHPAQAGGWTHF
ncbi:MAG: thiamine-phosphate kinase [Propionibacteriaceae bacterium]|nr:thiamine-phosphate kinase [Propionibacteriaceae bacterium]